MMEFSELKDVPLREAWPHEANDFTPWLADNLHRLSQAIGVDLELEGTEVSVEGFSADILARIPSDNSMVVIENQLENTDHTHLGQVLTYLAGLEAQTVIWIAREFQGPHLSAIRWLNTHTVDPFAFFAVKVRAVRIGDAPAPVAPLFEVLERPNDWDRRVKGAVDTSGNRRRAEFIPLRREFWSFYAERYQADNIPPDHSAHTVEHKIGGVIVYQSLSQDGVNVYISRDHPDYDAQTKDLAMEYGTAVTSELGSRNRSLWMNAWDSGNWSQMAEWLHDRLGQFRRIITEYGPETDDTETTPDE
jgi:hypothetical protein